MLDNHAIDSLLQASHFNSIGVALMASANSAGAIRAFKSALSTVQGRVRDLGGEESFRLGDAANCFHQEIQGLGDSFYFTYNRALLFDPSGVEGLDFVTALITFNLALAFHQIGLTTGKGSAFQRASTFYDFTASLAENGSSLLQSLAVAAKNNQALIQQGLGFYDQAQESLKFVRTVLDTLASLVDMEASPLIDTVIFTELYLNAETLKPPNAAPVA